MTIGIGRMPGIASPTSADESPAGIKPPGLSMTSRVKPWTMNIVDSVTTIGCRRRKAMKKPLKAPVSKPMPMPATDQTRMLDGVSCM